MLEDMWRMTKETVVALAAFPMKVFYTAYNLVTGKPRDIYGPMSIVGAAAPPARLRRRTDRPGGEAGQSVHRPRLGEPVCRAVQLRPAAAARRRASGRAMYEAFERPRPVCDRPDPGHVDTARLLPPYVVGGMILISGPC